MSRFWALTRRCFASGDGVRYLEGLANFEQRAIPDQSSTAAFPLDRIKRLLARLGDPQDAFRVVQVAGSSGKGSVATLLASIYSETDSRVGLSLSPHVLSVTERINVSTDGVLAPIPLPELDALIIEHRYNAQRILHFSKAFRELLEQLSSEGHGPTYFEVLTALCFLHFARNGVQHAVVETGLGGVTDGTNVFREVNVDGTVICPLEEEHVGVLGANLDEIIQNEVAIAKPHRPVILAPQFSLSVRDRVRALCAAQESPVMDIAEQISVRRVGYDVTDASVRQRVEIRFRHLGEDRVLEDVKMRLLGGHQLSNVQTAVAAALVAQEQGWPLTEDAIRRGVQTAFCPGRVQIQRASADSEWYVLDGAHTRHSAKALASTLRDVFPNEALVVIVGMVRRKQHDAVLTEILEMEPDVVIFTASGASRRAMPPGTLLAKWERCEAEMKKRKRFRCRKTLSTNVATALIKAQTELRGVSKPSAKSPGVICVTGTFYIIAEALESLQMDTKLGGS